MEDATKPTEQIKQAEDQVKEEIAADPEKAAFVAEEETEREAEIAEGVDRSAYNCTSCAGEGLLDQKTICPVCNGTGKVNG